MHGQKQCGNAQITKCAFYSWEEMLIIYVGKETHIMHGKKQCGNAHIKTCAFYASEEMLIIYVGEKDAYYAWAKTRWACQHEEIRILCVGRNAYNIRGEKKSYYAWAKRRWECPH